jgi:hypothetical protein
VSLGTERLVVRLLVRLRHPSLCNFPYTRVRRVLVLVHGACLYENYLGMLDTAELRFESFSTPGKHNIRRPSKSSVPTGMALLCVETLHLVMLPLRNRQRVPHSCGTLNTQARKARASRSFLRRILFSGKKEMKGS